MMKASFCGITYAQLSQLLTESGFDNQYALKSVTNFYRRRTDDFRSIDNIPGNVRKFLDSNFYSGLMKPVKVEVSSDMSVKYLFCSVDQKAFETVYIPEGKRKTICISTQSGCRMGCPFCLTGKSGFRGNLTSGEIINQVLSVPFSKEITHVVFMGMGEPLDNLDEVLTACSILTSSWGLAISPAHITVSTVGITPAVLRFLSESNCNLTLSLYSPFSDERAAVVPAEKRYPASEILNLMKNYPVVKKRRFSIAYIMIRDVNDSDSHLEELIRLLQETKIRVNILPYHAIDFDNYLPSTVGRMEYFREGLNASGISSSLRKSRGADISAACGLLAADKLIQ